MGSRPRVGVRELRQNLSVHLRRVKKGESLEVTERGSAVALLTPLPERASLRDRLVAEGRIKPATRKLSDLGPPIAVEMSRSTDEALTEQREERLT